MKTPLLALAVLFSLHGLVVAQSSTKPLVIEAAQFASLQAALDAVPTNGGVVLLPPGTFMLVLR